MSRAAALAERVDDEIGNGISPVTADSPATEETIRAMRALGSSIKAQPPGINLSRLTTGTTLTTGQAQFLAVYLETAQTITGVKWFQATQGSYTADSNNYVALYSYSGGTLTQVAISANDGNIWKAATFSWSSKAFASPYAAATGIYYIGLLYHRSAQVTAPVIGSANSLITNVIYTADFTNSAMLQGTLSGRTTLPTSQAMSGLTASIVQTYMALY